MTSKEFKQDLNCKMFTDMVRTAKQKLAGYDVSACYESLIRSSDIVLDENKTSAFEAAVKSEKGENLDSETLNFEVRRKYVDEYWQKIIDEEV